MRQWTKAAKPADNLVDISEAAIGVRRSGMWGNKLVKSTLERIDDVQSAGLKSIKQLSNLKKDSDIFKAVNKAYGLGNKGVSTQKVAAAIAKDAQLLSGYSKRSRPLIGRAITGSVKAPIKGILKVGDALSTISSPTVERAIRYGFSAPVYIGGAQGVYNMVGNMREADGNIFERA